MKESYSYGGRHLSPFRCGGTGCQQLQRPVGHHRQPLSDREQQRHPYPERDDPAESWTLVHTTSCMTAKTRHAIRCGQVTQPIHLYFNEFRPGYRPEMLDQMSKMFIDLFQVADPNMDIHDQLKDNFGQRLFVRRYVSSDNLKTTGIYADLFKGSTRLNYNKVWINSNG